jgi:hypothetical protein
LVEGAFHFNAALFNPPTAVTFVGADGSEYLEVAAPEMLTPLMPIRTKTIANMENLRRRELSIATPQHDFAVAKSLVSGTFE